MNNLEYIRDHYQVPAKVGARITYGIEKPVNGTIIGGKNARLRVRLDGGSKTVLLHPTWEVRYHGHNV